MSIKNLLSLNNKPWSDINCETLVCNQLVTANFESTSSNPTATGPWAAGQSIIIGFQRAGTLIYMDFPFFDSAATIGAVITIPNAVPVGFRPTLVQRFICRVIDNGAGVVGLCDVNTDGSLEFFASANNALFSGAGLTGVSGTLITWTTV